MRQRIAFLLGSGVSLHANLPRTSRITERVLVGDGVSRDSREIYYFAKSPPKQPDEYVPRVVSFVRRLKVEIDNYYQDTLHSIRETNYEDIYSVVIQLHDTLLGEFDNPAVAALAQKIHSDSWNLFVGRPGIETSDWSMLDMASEVTNYIADIVWHMLATAPSDLSYLGFLNECYLDDRFDGIDIFTLNHDTVVESYFDGAGIPVVDGFADPTNNVRYWDPQLLESTDKKHVRLVKLHGSINWFRFEDRPSLTLGIPLKAFWGTSPINYPPKGRPEILIGTHNKILSYSGAIYIDLHTLFHRSLRDTNTLVISGYSFNDKVINTRVIYWLSSKPRNKIILIHPNLESLRNSARPAIAQHLNHWIEQGKLSLVQKRIEVTSWTDVANLLP